jgi:hypothetical protein
MLQGVSTQFELTEKGLGILLAWIKRVPNDLATAARAAGYRPEDVLTWYWGGQTPGCPHPLWVALAWEVAQIRAKKAASNHRRVIKAAKAGESWAIEALDARLEKSAWATYPGRAVADELLGLAGSVETPALPAASPPDPDSHEP